MSCDNESCQRLVPEGVPVTVIIDAKMRQFCGLSCSITFLEGLIEHHPNSRKRVDRIG